ncbi:hypothetical protein BDB01DRAFT_853846 [Pilobolus umbonatus]|nr:hypothetical protein BDB01DRAFT_853846 [Pilobolus umbonatus]
MAFFFHSLKSIYTLNKICVRFIHKTEKWLPWEDELLKNYVEYNGKKWTEFVHHCLPNRSPQQCQIRWTDVVNPQLKKGSFSPLEKSTLKKAVSELGEGQWTKISADYLPERSPRRIANEWTAMTDKKPWTTEELELIVKGVHEFGPQWTKIKNTYLPSRTRMQIRQQYRHHLDPSVRKGKWTDWELELLLRRTIIYGQQWSKVAEGIPGRLPEQCQTIWINQLDPSLNKEPWSKEETRLYWERMCIYSGNYTKVAEGLPGRNRLMCYDKFWRLVYSKELALLYGEELEQKLNENKECWKRRISKLMCQWIDDHMTLTEDRQGFKVIKRGRWDQHELEALKTLVDEYTNQKRYLHMSDWESISHHFSNRNAVQCKYQYIQNLKEGEKESRWSQTEDDELKKWVNDHGTGDWAWIASRVSSKSARQCCYRWNRVLKYKDDEDIIKKKSLDENEKSLIREGVQMFGTDWNAIRMSYLPSRTPQQLMRWWSKHKDYDDNLDRHKWNEDEDEILKFAVDRYKNESGSIPWAKVASMITHRTPLQCSTRWEEVLSPGLKKGRWTYDEEMALVEIVQKMKLKKESGDIWTVVAKELNTGRSEGSCRKKFYYMQRNKQRFIWCDLD